MENLTVLDLEKDYYLGNYQSCINKANSMNATTESTFYLCLSYLQLKKYDILDLELKKATDAPCIDMLRLLNAYTQNPPKRAAIVDQLDEALEARSSNDPNQQLTRLAMAPMFVQSKAYAKALKALHGVDSLPVMLARVGIFLLMNRTDLAEKQLKLMINTDDYSTLTLLASAQVRLATGAAKEAHDISKELEDIYKPTSVIKNLQAAAAILMTNYDLAREHCEVSLDLNNDNPEALINMMFVLSKLKAAPEIKARHFDRLKTISPDHEFVREIDKIELELASA